MGKKNSLYIIGAGDFGREMESWLEVLPGFDEKFAIKGYLDDNANALKGFPSDYEIVGTPLGFDFKKDDYALLAITNPATKKKFAEGLKGKVIFFTYIAPTVTLGKYTNIHDGAIICHDCFISTNTEIGSFVIINVGSRIGHDCIIEPFCSLMADVDLGGHVKIGECVFAGTKSTIIPRKSVNGNIIIGSGSVVIKNLTKKGTYFGNPAKLIGF